MQFRRGFTLVEVLVALAIFAVLSAAGWVVFDQLIKNRDRNAQHVAQLTQLQSAYAQLLRDFSQTAPVSGQENEQIYPAIALENNTIRLNKAGVLDPLQQGLDQFEFVEYRYDSGQQALVRAKSANIYRKSNQNLQGDQILAPIENLQFKALDPAVQDRWPAQVVMDGAATEYLATQLPKGIEVTFKYQNRDYRWVFALVNALPLATESTPNG